ncbi:glycosyltransferase family 4 protein [Bizionia sediminis]|uniref:Glycosyltransferase family 4 protein n=1 Tax=Bizionia sediminis TaxID=1737064 RepID=A0ABW5KQ28_9FLAO
MSKKLKIAIYSGQIPSTTFIESLIKAVAKTHQVILFGSQTKAVNYNSTNIIIHKTPKGNGLKLLYNTWRSLKLVVRRPRDLWHLLKDVNKHPSAYKKWQAYSRLLPMVLYKPDIIHIQWAKSLEEFMLLKIQYNIPIILSLRGAHINYSPIASRALAKSYRKNFPQVTAFHAVSDAIGIEAQKYGAPPDRITVIHSLVPQVFLDAYQPIQQRISKPFKIISVGRPHWIKGYPDAIYAIAALKKQGFAVTYQIIGMDTPDEELLFLIAELGLQKQVTLRGNVQQAELIKIMQDQDALLLSSLEEGIANVVLEAMAIGLPVISTNCGGMSEVVIPNKTGFLVPVRDPEAMAQAILELYALPISNLQQQIQRAHNLIKTKFNTETNMATFLTFYENIYKK